LIRKKLEQITEADFIYLKENEVPEGISIEYKKELMLKDREQKAEFLADVISFANSGGGDLLIGIDEKNGIPVAMMGIDVLDQDDLALQVENICRDKIEPRISGLRTHFVKLANGRYVFVLRIAQSWNGPHRNMYSYQFFMRNSRGKAPMDVSELRSAFTQSMQAIERIREFRASRLKALSAKKTPVELVSGLTMVLHIAPVAAVTTDLKIDVDKLGFRNNPFMPFGEWEVTGNNPNLDGRVAFDKDAKRPSYAYTQLFRTGLLECTYVFPKEDFGNGEEEIKVLPQSYEKLLKRNCENFIKQLADLGFDGPTVLMLSFVDARGTVLEISQNYPSKEKLRDDDFILPDVIREPDEELMPVLVSLYKMVWNGFGKVRPPDQDQ
jgi:hypothetical protein